MAVPLNSHKLGNLDSPIFADSTKVVPRQVHEHHVFGSFLFILKQFGCKCFVSRRVASEGSRSRDGKALRVATDLPGQHLWAGPDYFPVAKLEVVHVWRRIDPPQRPVEPEEDQSVSIHVLPQVWRQGNSRVQPRDAGPEDRSQRGELSHRGNATLHWRPGAKQSTCSRIASG